MSYSVCGYCTHCGAAFHVPHVWYGIYPPSPQPSCTCYAVKRPVNATIGNDVPWGPYKSQTPWGFEEKTGTFTPRVDPFEYEDYTPKMDRPKKASVPSLSREERMAETRKRITEIQRKQKEQEANDLSGIASLGTALENAENEERLEDIEKRMDRLEHMMVTTAQTMQEIKAILREKVAEETKAPPPDMNSAETK